MENREVINWLTRIRDRLMTTNSKQYEALTIAIATLKKQEQDRWIPVTERLPELESEVLVTDEYGEIRHADYSDWLGKAEFRTVEESMTLEDVKAWRPLPAPYQEDEA